MISKTKQTNQIKHISANISISKQSILYLLGAITRINMKRRGAPLRRAATSIMQQPYFAAVQQAVGTTGFVSGYEIFKQRYRGLRNMKWFRCFIVNEMRSYINSIQCYIIRISLFQGISFIQFQIKVCINNLNLVLINKIQPPDPCPRVSLSEECKPH